jgi:flagellar biosynthetic protein FliP
MKSRTGKCRRLLPLAVIAITLAMASAFATAQQLHEVGHATSVTGGVATTQPASSFQLPDLASRTNIGSTLQFVAILSIVSLAPAILLMVTSFTRIMIVLSLLRQALGAQQLPPNQVLAALAIFMTLVVMTPTWQRVNSDALQPYLHGELDLPSALHKGMGPLRDFMSRLIERAGNDGDVDVFTDAASLPRAKSWNDVPTTALVPAFMLSELKTAFALGFRIFLPFLVIDLVVSMLLVSMGMMMMPPTLVSLPFKLLLFVMVDGWRLITGGLLGSFVG